MRILWVKADKLLPVHNGGNIRSFHILRALASEQEVQFVSYYGGAQDPGYERALKEQLPGAVCIHTEVRQLSGAARGVDYFLHLFEKPPYAVSRFRSKRVQEMVRNCLRQQPDVAVCDFLDAAVNFPEQCPVPVVLFQHNVESEIWRRHAIAKTNPLQRHMYQLEYRKMLRYESRTVRRFDHVIAVSEHDRQLMSAWVPASKISVISTGVDLEQYSPAMQARQEQPLVVFVGAMDWEPNIDGVEYFCKDIWPSVLRQIPDARFRIVGRNPGRRVQNLTSESVTITGQVPSVVEHLHEAAVVIVPLRVGGGTRLKIYEAMAAGKAVVSTSVGAEGLDFLPDRDLILADDPSSFAQSVVNMLGDAELRLRYEQAAAKQAAKYGWPAIGRAFGEDLGKVVQNFKMNPRSKKESLQVSLDPEEARSAL